MIDVEFEGWRITVGDDGKVYFSNRPLVEEAKQLGQSEPALEHVGIPIAVLSQGKDLAQCV